VAEEPFTAIGRIARTHGLKGEVSVVIDHDASLDALLGLELWVVPPPPSRRSMRLVSVRPGPKGPLCLFDGIDSIDDARVLTGRQLLARTEDLPESHDRDEDADLVGFLVIDEERGPVGSVTETIITGANDVWVIDGPLGQVLIPVIEDVVIGIDDDERTIDVRLLPGLVDDEGRRT
jgi:16S rRNA processing protein RimM